MPCDSPTRANHRTGSANSSSPRAMCNEPASSSITSTAIQNAATGPGTPGWYSSWRPLGTQPPTGSSIARPPTSAPSSERCMWQSAGRPHRCRWYLVAGSWSISRSSGTPYVKSSLEKGSLIFGRWTAIPRTARCSWHNSSPPPIRQVLRLLALYLLFDRVRGGSGESAAGLSDLGEKLLGEDTHVAELAQRYRFASRLVSTARGNSYPTAREAALKLMETSYLSARRSLAPTSDAPRGLRKVTETL